MNRPFIPYEEMMMKNDEEKLLGQLKGSVPQDMSPYIAASTQPKISPAQSAQIDEAQMASLVPAAAGGAMAGGPAGAAMMVGGQILAQAMANEAQAKQAQRQRAIEIAQQHSQGERQGIDQMLSAWRGALR